MTQGGVRITQVGRARHLSKCGDFLGRKDRQNTKASSVRFTSLDARWSQCRNLAAKTVLRGPTLYPAWLAAMTQYGKSGARAWLARLNSKVENNRNSTLLAHQGPPLLWKVMVSLVLLPLPSRGRRVLLFFVTQVHALATMEEK